MNKKFLFLILILIILAGFFFFWFFQNRIFQKEMLRVEILGPSTVKMGEEIEYAVKYKNEGSFILENISLIFDLPPYSLTEGGKTRILQDLPNLKPGEEGVVKIKARLLGREKEFKTAKAIISYTPENFTVKYEVETTFTTQIDMVPLTLNFNLPSKIEGGKPFSTLINYFSTADCSLENLSLKFFPPSDFEVESVSPNSLENFEWRIEKLSKTEGGKIEIKGKLYGDPDQVFELKAQLGIWQNGDFVILKEVTKEIQLVQPLISISQKVNGSSSYVASPGETLSYEIFFKNLSDTPFEDLFLIVRISGPAVDFDNISVKNGYLQVDKGLIMWDNKDNILLKYLPPNEEGKVSFQLKLKDYWEGIGNSEGQNLVTTEVNLSQVKQKFFVKINAGLVISQTAYYKSDEFLNTGPVPPRVNETTTFTIRWEIKNYFNDIKDVKVKATLAPNVVLTGKILPTDQFSNFSFDSNSREVVWLVGDVGSGTGVKGDPYRLSFQIAFTPPPEQRGSIAPLISKVEISGENQFTNTTIVSSDSAIDTSLPDDFLNSGGGIVQ